MFSGIEKHNAVLFTNSMTGNLRFVKRFFYALEIVHADSDTAEHFIFGRGFAPCFPHRVLLDRGNYLNVIRLIENHRVSVLCCLDRKIHTHFVRIGDKFGFAVTGYFKGFHAFPLGNKLLYLHSSVRSVSLVLLPFSLTHPLAQSLIFFGGSPALTQSSASVFRLDHSFDDCLLQCLCGQTTCIFQNNHNLIGNFLLHYVRPPPHKIP